MLKNVHAKGQGTGPKEEVGQVLYMRGLISAMLAVEGVKRAQEKYGKGKVVTGEQARWGFENLALDQKLDRAGLCRRDAPHLQPPAPTTMGANWARIHTWDGKKWNFSSDWLRGRRVRSSSPWSRPPPTSTRPRRRSSAARRADCQS